MKKLLFFTAAGMILFGCSGKTSVAQTDENVGKMEETKEIVVLLQTTLGDIKLKLYNETPLHRDNFVKLVEEGYYDGLLFHRVINNFMIQGGDPDSRNARQGQMLGNGGPGYTVPAEFVDGKYHKKGALAAARMGDNVNPTKASSGSQFYIVQGQVFTEEQIGQMTSQGMNFSANQREIYTTMGGSPWLDGDYTVFGETIEGLDVIDKIATVKTGAADRPVEDVKIIKASIVK